MATAPAKPVRVGLFVTCLVDLFRPAAGMAAVRLLESAGCSVEVPALQTCCGQPAYNAGDRASARALAKQTIAAFEGFPYIVAPSGSCAGMLRVHYPQLLADDGDDDGNWGARAAALAGRVHELTAFLADVMRWQPSGARYAGRVTYHDGCAGLRELGVRAQPRRLLAAVAGLELAELAETGTCCGFGGAFCVKYPEISGRMAADKSAAVTATGADSLLAGDMGCLMNIAGDLARRNSPVQVRHVAEVLAGMTETPPIAGSAPVDGKG